MRTLSPKRIKKLPIEVRKARLHLKENGYTYQEAADALERHRTHLATVLAGKRPYKTLCARILTLPANH